MIRITKNHNLTFENDQVTPSESYEIDIKAYTSFEGNIFMLIGLDLSQDKLFGRFRGDSILHEELDVITVTPKFERKCQDCNTQSSETRPQDNNSQFPLHLFTIYCPGTRLEEAEHPTKHRRLLE